MHSDIYRCYCAIQNELAVDRDVVRRFDYEWLRFIPVRPLKSIPYLKAIRYNRFLYALFSAFFVLLAPAFFLYLAAKELFFNVGKVWTIQSRREYIRRILCSNEILIVGSNASSVSYHRLNRNTDFEVVDIRGGCGNICYFLGVLDYAISYIYAVFTLCYVLLRGARISDCIQCYVAFEWHLVNRAFKRMQHYRGEIFFSNHYDRWALLIDGAFMDARLNLIQHGSIDPNFVLPFKLCNVAHIYKFYMQKEDAFFNFIERKQLAFHNIEFSLNLVRLSEGDKPSILIVGFPLYARDEVVIANAVEDIFDVYIKPHPVYGVKGYEGLAESVKLISDKATFPLVDIVVCFDSTLGFEYESTGIPVLWWRGLTPQLVIDRLRSGSHCF